MIWITLLAFAFAGALLKLGMATVVVSVLSVALIATTSGLAVLLALFIWRSGRR